VSTALDESLLGSEQRLAAADRTDLLRATATAGAQVRQSLALSEEAGVPAALAGLRPRAVLLAADPVVDDVAVLVAALAARPEAAAPVIRVDGPALPMWAGAMDVLLVAGSAGTPTATAGPALVEAAARRGMTVLGAGPDGSVLHEACGRNRQPYVSLPTGRHPRADFWAPLVPLLLAAGELGLIPQPAMELRRCADLLDALAERVRPGSETYGNPAKSLALDLAESVPVLIGTTAAGGAAAYRAAGQLAATGRDAAWGTLPVAEHRLGGLLAGDLTGSGDDLFRDRVDDVVPARPRLVLIRAGDEPDHVRAQADELVAGCGPAGVPVTEVVAEEAAGPVGRFASVTGLLDFTAAYVGIASGTPEDHERDR
jgi:glucose/mannose-6-phosphate isomerase